MLIDTDNQGMNTKQNCKNPSCMTKGSILKVFTIQHYLLKKVKTRSFDGIEKEKEVWTNKQLSLFYFCKKCFWIANFRLVHLPSEIKFWLYVIPEEDYEKLQEIKSMRKPACIYCEFNRDPPNKEKNESQPSIIKFILEGNREFFGYYCRICQRNYIKPIKEVNWKNFKGWNESIPINVLDNAIKFYPKEKNETRKQYGERLNKTKKYVEFRRIGGHEIILSAPTEDNFIYHTIGFPRFTAKRYLKLLEKRGCKIDI